MAMATLMNGDNDTNSEENRLLKEIEQQNQILMQMKKKNKSLDSPANSKLINKLHNLEKKINESNKKDSGKNMNYFFNQMMMMMMMNPSKN